jgi:hypothetical protein
LNDLSFLKDIPDPAAADAPMSTRGTWPQARRSRADRGVLGAFLVVRWTRV